MQAMANALFAFCLRDKRLEANEVFRVTICCSFDLLFPFISMYQYNYVLDHYLYYDEVILKYFLKGQIQTLSMKHEKYRVNLSWLLTFLIYSD